MAGKACVKFENRIRPQIGRGQMPCLSQQMLQHQPGRHHDQRLVLQLARVLAFDMDTSPHPARGGRPIMNGIALGLGTLYCNREKRGFTDYLCK